MKSCPACNTQYSDDTLVFCLQDGTPLASSGQTETPTMVRGEIENVLAHSGQVSDPSSSPRQQSQETHVATAMPTKKGSNAALIAAIAILSVIILLGIVGFGAYVFYQNSQRRLANSPANMSAGPVNTNYNANPTPSVTPSNPTTSPTAMPTLAPPRPPAIASYPSTRRLTFARGAYSTSFGGDLNSGGTRSLVLGCRSGQSLSATVSGGNGCVTIRGGGSSLRTTTNGGDNYITLINSCSTVVRFSISITII